MKKSGLEICALAGGRLGREATGALAKAEVLILDDLGLGSPTEAQRHDLLEVMEDRQGRRSIVVTRQLPVSKWNDWMGDPTVADAVHSSAATLGARWKTTEATENKN